MADDNAHEDDAIPPTLEHIDMSDPVKVWLAWRSLARNTWGSYDGKNGYGAKPVPKVEREWAVAHFIPWIQEMIREMAPKLGKAKEYNVGRWNKEVKRWNLVVERITSNSGEFLDKPEADDMWARAFDLSSISTEVGVPASWWDRNLRKVGTVVFGPAGMHLIDGAVDAAEWAQKPLADVMDGINQAGEFIKKGFKLVAIVLGGAVVLWLINQVRSATSRNT